MDLLPAGAYVDPKRRRDSDVAFRRSLARDLRAAADLLPAWQRRLIDAGRFADLPAIEVEILRMGRISDRLASPTWSYGAWFRAKSLDETSQRTLTRLDRSLATAVDTLGQLCPVLSRDGEHENNASVLAGLISDLEREVERRAAVLAGPEAPRSDKRFDLRDVYLGEEIDLAGHRHRVVGCLTWDRGDRAIVLDDLADHLRLWQDPGGGAILFERQTIDLPEAPSSRIILQGETFMLSWTDAGSGILQAGAASRPVRAERWLYQGDAGGWLWHEGPTGALRAWRGLGAGTISSPMAG